MEQVPLLNRVVLIDDEEFDQIAYRRILSRSGLVGEIVAFRSAIDALEWFRDNPPPVDVIFLDINMPRMNGFEFLEAFEQQPACNSVQAIVVMLTTSLEPEDRKCAESFDLVRAFVNKPLMVEHVCDAAKLSHRRKAA